MMERHFRYFGARLPDAWASAAFGFAMGAALLAASAAGQKAGVISFLGLTGLLTLLFPHAVIRANARNALLWLIPAWALFSAVWSTDADRTLHSVMLLAPTLLAGIALGGLPCRSATVAGLSTALVGYMTYSIGYGATAMFSDTGQGGEAMVGITNGKNYFGHLAAITFLTTPIFFAYAKGRWTMVARCFAIGAAAISGFALYKSHATGSILATGIGVMVMLTVLLIRHISWQFRIVVIAAVLGVIILYVVFGQQLQEEVMNTILRTFRKDTTLTGRTFLWEQADRLIAQRPMLGYGYRAFWYYTNPEAWTLWRMMGVAPMSGFNFHNTARDMLVELGWSGLILFVVTYGYAAARTTVRSLIQGDLTSAVGLGFVAYFVVRMPVETTGISDLTIETLLLLTFLCVSLRPNPLAEAAVDVRHVPQYDPRRPSPEPVRPASARPALRSSQ